MQIEKEKKRRPGRVTRKLRQNYFLSTLRIEPSTSEHATPLPPQMTKDGKTNSFNDELKKNED